MMEDIDTVSLLDAVLPGYVFNDKYLVEKQLGEGGAGIVYRVVDIKSTEPAALKLLHRHVAIYGQGRKRFEREAKVLLRLVHPNIVRLLDYGIASEGPFIVMELLEGHNVKDLVKDQGQLQPERCLEITRQMLAGLAYAHDQDVIHRDLKPSNLILQTDHGHETLKLLDFGLAKSLADEDNSVSVTVTQLGTVLGTPQYMAPEQAVGGIVHKATDVYAAGAVLFELLTGEPPFSGETCDELIMAHLNEPVRSIKKIRPDLQIDPMVVEVVEKALAKKRQDRFQDAKEMLRALNAISQPAGMLTTQTAEPAGLPRVLHEASSSLLNRRWVLTIFSAAVVILIGCLAIVVSRSCSDSQTNTVPRGSLPPPADPWASNPPDKLALIHKKITKGLAVSQQDRAQLRNYIKKSPKDSRPVLLLGHIYAADKRESLAISTYRKAFALAPATRGDPRVLSVLLKVSASAEHGDEACEAIAVIYGLEALSAVQSAIANASPESSHWKRLKDLEAKLAKQPFLDIWSRITSSGK